MISILTPERFVIFRNQFNNVFCDIGFYFISNK